MRACTGSSVTVMGSRELYGVRSGTQISSSPFADEPSCMFAQICENGAELFHLSAGEEWTCKFSESGYYTLADMLQEGPRIPSDTDGCRVC